MFTAESAGERILKISQHLAKLWARVECPAFLTHDKQCSKTMIDQLTNKRYHNCRQVMRNDDLLYFPRGFCDHVQLSVTHQHHVSDWHWQSEDE